MATLPALCARMRSASAAQCGAAILAARNSGGSLEGCTTQGKAPPRLCRFPPSRLRSDKAPDAPRQIKRFRSTPRWHYAAHLMKVASFEAIVQALNREGVRFLVVGGLAVNAHGYLRFTKDVDLVVRLQRSDILGAFRALRSIDFHPAVPITAEQFADPELREQWRREKGMLVLKFWSDQHRETPVDVFIYEPFDFAREEASALHGASAGDPDAGFVDIPALIAMKREAARPQDLIDIEKLQALLDIRRKSIQ